jgi:hypothetical protein
MTPIAVPPRVTIRSTSTPVRPQPRWTTHGRAPERSALENTNLRTAELTCTCLTASCLRSGPRSLTLTAESLRDTDVIRHRIIQMIRSAAQTGAQRYTSRHRRRSGRRRARRANRRGRACTTCTDGRSGWTPGWSAGPPHAARVRDRRVAACGLRRSCWLPCSRTSQPPSAAIRAQSCTPRASLIDASREGLVDRDHGPPTGRRDPASLWTPTRPIIDEPRLTPRRSQA